MERSVSVATVSSSAAFSSLRARLLACAVSRRRARDAIIDRCCEMMAAYWASRRSADARRAAIVFSYSVICVSRRDSFVVIWRNRSRFRWISASRSSRRVMASRMRSKTSSFSRAASDRPSSVASAMPDDVSLRPANSTLISLISAAFATTSATRLSRSDATASSSA